MEKMFARNFSLEPTLESGQIFRFKKINDWYFITAKNRLFKIRQNGIKIEFDGADKKFITHFFALDEKYDKIISAINKDEIINAAIEDNYGLRIMRQDPWECAVSFLISQNSNIPRITKNIHSLCEGHGKELRLDDQSSCTFPSPKDIADSKKLSKFGLGYRQAYLKELATKTNRESLRKLENLPFEEALERITELPGIGDKVGQCVLLFSLNHYTAFPVDVWIEKAMKQLYNLDKSLSSKHIQSLGRTYFGKYAGYAQQFIYHYSRNNRYLFEEVENEANNRRKAKALI
ncbi:MAG TPA: DNA glycosylase [Candidatus Nanoarchaeia archaeon]|nr:DNA glycosylase [Candidatus Nanoarchaeia archaeon]